MSINVNEEEFSVVQRRDEGAEINRLCCFKIGDGHYAISVFDVQEVTETQQLTRVPLAPDYIIGLINLRGQIVTAISLRKLFGINNDREEHINIIVRFDDSFYSLVVDEILDVIDVEKETFEHTPDTLNQNIKKFILGVHKLEGKLLTVLCLEKLLNASPL